MISQSLCIYPTKEPTTKVLRHRDRSSMSPKCPTVKWKFQTGNVNNSVISGKQNTFPWPKVPDYHDNIYSKPAVTMDKEDYGPK